MAWACKINLGGVDVSARLTRRVRVEMEEGSARVAEFTLVPATGSVDPSAWVGASVTIDYDTGTPVRLFTGVVDVPEYDPITGLTLFRCTDGLQEHVAGQTRAALDTLIAGKWSDDVFNDDADGWEYAQAQLQTVPASLDLDTDGSTLRLTNWAAKVSADYTFGPGDVIDRSLNLSLASRRELHNVVNLEFDYRFTRRRHRQVSYSWAWQSQAGFPGFCEWLADTTDLPDENMIRSAAESTGWTVQPKSWSFTDLPPSDPSPCPFSGGWINNTAPTRFLLSASWSAARRTSQAVTEEYRLTVRAPQSINALGEVERDLRGVAQTPVAVDDWERDPAIGVPTGAVLDGLGDYILDDHDRAQMDAAGETLLARARVTILAAHRKNFVQWQSLIRPEIDRQHTLRLEAMGVTAQGKAAQVVHEMDMDQGSALTQLRIAVSRSLGTATVTDTALTLPAAPDTVPAEAPE